MLVLIGTFAISIFLVSRQLKKEHRKEMGRKADKTYVKDEVRRLEKRQNDLDREFHDNIQNLGHKIDSNHKEMMRSVQDIYKTLINGKRN